MAFWLSALAGGFWSEATSTCMVTLGSSGGVFGLLGAFIADAAFNFASISYPFYRLVVLVIFAVLWLSTSFGDGQISHSSHLAGVVYGGALGVLCLPSLPLEWMESAAPLLGALLTLLWARCAVVVLLGVLRSGGAAVQPWCVTRSFSFTGTCGLVWSAEVLRCSAPNRSRSQTP